MSKEKLTLDKVVIVKGRMRKTVTHSIYENFFKNHNWNIVGDEEQAEEEWEQEVEEEQEEDWGEDDDEEEQESTEVKKPLSSMNRNELMSLANELGIGYKGNDSNEVIRNKIKEVM